MTALWIVGALVGWLMLATAAALLVGRAIRRRDRQVPRHHDARTGEPGRHHERTRT